MWRRRELRRRTSGHPLVLPFSLIPRSPQRRTYLYPSLAWARFKQYERRVENKSIQLLRHSPACTRWDAHWLPREMFDLLPRKSQLQHTFSMERNLGRRVKNKMCGARERMEQLGGEKALLMQQSSRAECWRNGHLAKLYHEAVWVFRRGWLRRLRSLPPNSRPRVELRLGSLMFHDYVSARDRATRYSSLRDEDSRFTAPKKYTSSGDLGVEPYSFPEVKPSDRTPSGGLVENLTWEGFESLIYSARPRLCSWWLSNMSPAMMRALWPVLADETKTPFGELSVHKPTQGHPGHEFERTGSSSSSGGGGARLSVTVSAYDHERCRAITLVMRDPQPRAAGEPPLSVYGVERVELPADTCSVIWKDPDSPFACEAMGSVAYRPMDDRYWRAFRDLSVRLDTGFINNWPANYAHERTRIVSSVDVPLAELPDELLTEEVAALGRVPSAGSQQLNLRIRKVYTSGYLYPVRPLRYHYEWSLVSPLLEQELARFDRKRNRRLAYEGKSHVCHRSETAESLRLTEGFLFACAARLVGTSAHLAGLTVDDTSAAAAATNAAASVAAAAAAARAAAAAAAAAARPVQPDQRPQPPPTERTKQPPPKRKKADYLADGLGSINWL